MKKELLHYISKNKDAIILTIIIHIFLFVVLDITEIAFIPPKEQREIGIEISTELFEEEGLDENEEKELSDEEYQERLKQNITNRFASLDKFTNEVENKTKSISRKSLQEARKIKDLFSDEGYKRNPYGDEVIENNFYSDIKKDKTFTGKSNVSYSLKGRKAIKIFNPIYTCPKGGEVVINIEVDSQGNIIKVSLNKQKSNTTDGCLTQTAIKYAKKSYFDVKSSVKRQRGFIVYNFM